MASTLTFTTTPFTSVTQFTIADTTVAKNIIATSSSVRRVYGLTVLTDETAAKDLVISITDGTTTWKLTTINIPLGSGNTNAVIPVDAFSSTQFVPYIRNRDAGGAPYIHLPVGWTLKAAYGATMTAAKLANIYVVGESY
jgi:hypothetical protein